MRRLTLLLLTLPLLAGCVSETRPAEDRGVSPFRPVASPVVNPEVSQSSHVRVLVTPLGSIAYDGQTLPLFSPDGRFMAVAEGTPPPWEALLARDGATVPLASSIRIHQLREDRVEPVHPLNAGRLLLGRSANDQGFLVERLEEDGARHIGRVNWITWQVDWIVRTSDVNAHAVDVGEGSIAFIRREPGKRRTTLVVRGPDGNESTIGGIDVVMPLQGARPDLLPVLVRDGGGLTLASIELTEDGRLGAVLAGMPLCRGESDALAYQIAAPNPGVLPGILAQDEFIVFHPDLMTVAAVDPLAREIRPMPKGTAAAAITMFGGVSGYFAGTPEGLVFIPYGHDTRKPGARVIADDALPIPTTNPDRPLYVVGPAGARRLMINLVRPAGTTAIAPN